MLTQLPPVLVMLRLKQVIERTGLSRSTIYGKLDSKSTQYDPNFPTQVPLGNGAVRWVDAEINAWLEQCVNSSRSNSPDLFVKVSRKVGKRNASVA
ncbi:MULTISPECIES: AlpA family transcriptional regulator [unclassified Pseudomonas]|uniref:helix-turn-helix transcriptional regulator n=1 Tax=unclassified Pseudomonas TaxID=196821 RepID=UPI0021147959|nr:MULTISPECIES: AlpA family phage regulatory protein [unclassified Pseudomonas]